MAQTPSDLLSSTTSVQNLAGSTKTLNLAVFQDDYTLPTGSPLVVESSLGGSVNSGTLSMSNIFQAYASSTNNTAFDFTNGPQTATLNGSTFQTGSATGVFNRIAGSPYALSSNVAINLTAGGKINFSDQVNVTAAPAGPLSLNGNDYLVPNTTTASDLTHLDHRRPDRRHHRHADRHRQVRQPGQRDDHDQRQRLLQLHRPEPEQRGGYTVTETPPAGDSHVGQTSTTAGAVTNTPPGTPAVVSNIVLTTATAPAAPTTSSRRPTVSINGTDYLTPTPGSTTPSTVTIAGTTVTLTGTDDFGNPSARRPRPTPAAITASPA